MQIIQIKFNLIHNHYLIAYISLISNNLVKNIANFLSALRPPAYLISHIQECESFSKTILHRRFCFSLRFELWFKASKTKQIVYHRNCLSQALTLSKTMSRSMRNIPTELAWYYFIGNVKFPGKFLLFNNFVAVSKTPLRSYSFSLFIR